jgi:WD40 repeat protein
MTNDCAEAVMFFRFVVTAAFLLSISSLSAAQDAKPAAPPAAKITYDEHVRPILREHCFSCHSVDKQESGLQLDTYQKTMAGGSSGEIVLAGDLGSSRLWHLVSHAEEPKMPPRQDKLAAAKLDLISKWIEQGAPENAGSKVTIKKNPLAAVAATTDGKPAGPVAMPVGLFKQPVHYTARPGQVTALATSPWAPLVAVAGQKQVIIYHSESGELVGVLPFPEGIPYVIRFSRNGSVLLAAGGRGGHSGCVVLFDVQSGKRIAKIGDELDAVLAADINSQHTLVALGGPSRVVRIYSAQTGELQSEIRKHTDWVNAVEFSPDGKLLASADRSGGLFIWEAETARETANLRGHNGGIQDVTWRLDSKILATGGDDATVKLWELDESKVLKSWTAHAGGAFCVRFAHDGRLVSAGRDNSVKTWSADGAAQKSYPAFAEPALRCAFTHDDKRVIGGDWLGNVKAWDAEKASPVLTLAANPPTLAMQVEGAKKNLAAKQAEHSAAESDLVAAAKAVAEKEQAAQAATQTVSALATAVKALEQAQAAAKLAGIQTESLAATMKTTAAAIPPAQAATEKLAKENAEAAAKLAAAKTAAKATKTAVDAAQAALAQAEADQKAFAELGSKLAAASEAAAQPIPMLASQLAQAQAETAAANDAVVQKSTAAKTIADQIAALQAELAKALAQQKAAEESAAAKAKAVADAQAALEGAQAAADAAQAEQRAFIEAYGGKL